MFRVTALAVVAFGLLASAVQGQIVIQHSPDLRTLGRAYYEIGQEQARQQRFEQELQLRQMQLEAARLRLQQQQSFGPVYVHGYTRWDGTYVPGH